ncbi:MAG: biosynthetic-type acetolactate synthase large subunit [Lachnospiraceae bacterium]
MKGTELFIKALIKEKTDTLFAYPGSAVITLFDALYKEKDIRMILGRHEQALVHAADGYARSTGKTGVCLVTSGPGATNIVTGIATANYDSVPLVCFCGQVRRDLIGNDAFQEVDIVGITRGITKHSFMVTDRRQLGRAIREAFFIAGSGRPGPVVVDLPVDMLNESGSDDYPEDVFIRSYRPSAEPHIGQVKRAAALLVKAEKPLFLAGGGIHISQCQQAFTKLAEQTGIPVISSIMGRGAIATTHPLYIGNLGMHGCFAANRAVMECDVLCSIGSRFNDRITGKTDEFAPNAQIIHIDIDTASISRNIKVDIPIVADARRAVAELIRYTGPSHTGPWLDEIRAWQAQASHTAAPGTSLTPAAVIRHLNRTCTDSIFVTDVGQHQMWTAQYIELDEHRKLLTSGGLGTMGYGLPAALGAQLANPGRNVICISGDGGIQMNIQELATAVLEELPVIIIIMNNSYLGMVRQWQQLMYDRHYAGTDLKSGNRGQHKPDQYVPDFIRLAASYNAPGFRVSTPEQLHCALQSALAEKHRPTVIECIIDSEALVLPMVKAGCSLNEMIIGDEQ